MKFLTLEQVFEDDAKSSNPVFSRFFVKKNKVGTYNVIDNGARIYKTNGVRHIEPLIKCDPIAVCFSLSLSQAEEFATRKNKFDGWNTFSKLVIPEIPLFTCVK